MGSTFCAYFDQDLCRSCSWIGQDYANQLAAKETKIRGALDSLGRVALDPSFASPTQGFRNRAKMVVTGSLSEPVIGLQGREDLDRGQELLRCPIHHPKLNELMALMPRFIREAGLEPYRIGARKGELKGLIAFYSAQNRQMYLRFVLRSKEGIPRIEKALPELQARMPELVCVSANIQPVPHAILEGPEEVPLTQRTSIELEMGELRLELAPQAFVQTNTQVASALYETAASWAKEAAVSRMAELFSGQGAFSFAAAHVGIPELLGIEINSDAVRAAQATARAQGLESRLRFQCADAGRVGEELRTFGPGLVLVNPPRRGVGSEGVELLAKSGAAHLIYSSCALESLARDLKQLQATYPRVRRVRLFDMFPHTEHFETLVWLERAHLRP